MICTICLKSDHRAASCPRRSGQRLAIVLAALTLTACANQPVSVSVRSDAYCSIYKPLSWVPDDTTKTIDGIRRENSKHGKLCARKT